MIGLIGGTGLGEALLGEARGQERTIDTPFGPPSSPVHLARWNGLELAIIARHGPGHRLNPSQVPYRANIYALKSLGVTHVLASGAVGSLREDIHPRELVLPDQLIDRTCRRPNTFFDEGLAVHVDFAHPYCPRLRQRLIDVAQRVGVRVHTRGTYICMEGPAFSTIAESHLHRSWGGHVIGMTSSPEARLAREAEMCYALIALVTDYDCWRPHEATRSKDALLREIIRNLEVATSNAVELMRAAVESFATRPPEPCDCQDVLELAIWSDRRNLSGDLLRKYGPLLARYAPR